MRALLALLCVFVSLTGCVRRVALLPPDDSKEPDPPPGMVQVNVVNDDDGRVWDVRAGGPPICQTPCTETVNASSSLLLTSNHRERLLVPAMAVEAPGASRALVVAEGTNDAEQINGIVFTTLGGMGAVAGITLTAVGCSDLQRHSGLCTAGLITSGVTFALTAVSIWMILDSGPRAHVLPVFKTNATNGLPPVTFALTPTGVLGTF